MVNISMFLMTIQLTLLKMVFWKTDLEETLHDVYILHLDFGKQQHLQSAKIYSSM